MVSFLLYNKARFGVGSMELGNENNIIKEIEEVQKRVKNEKNYYIRIALYNYLGNLYSALSVIKNKKMYPNKKDIFGNLDNYRKFMKWTDVLSDRFDDNFIFLKEFHQDYLNDILLNTELIFKEKIDGLSYSDENDSFSKKDFLDVFHDFCYSLGLEGLYNEIINKKIIYMEKGMEYDNYLGITIHNPVTGNSNILIDKFDYNLDSMFTLAHELGHYYDLFEFNNSCNIKTYVDYTYKSSYQEVISKMFERLFLYYLIKNNIMVSKAEDKLIDMEIINRDFIFNVYALSLLDDEFIEHDRYQSLSNEEMFNFIKIYFENPSGLQEAIDVSDMVLFSDIQYAYGDILSMFLKEAVLAEGLESVTFQRFMKTRALEFNDDYIIEEGFTPDKYSLLYEKEVQLVKKKKEEN
jgi:hypothetical protein